MNQGKSDKRINSDEKWSIYTLFLLIVLAIIIYFSHEFNLL